MVSDFSKPWNNGEGENRIGTGCWSNGLVNKWMGGKGVFWSFAPRTGDHWCSWWWTWWCTHGAARPGGTGRRLNHRCQQVCQIPTAPPWHPWHDQMLVPAPEIGLEKAMVGSRVGPRSQTGRTLYQTRTWWWWRENLGISELSDKYNIFL